ncbi:surface lipoprotein assembly modifier [Ruegeria sp. PrR005]|uniref:DUF560 domain-containing protein n=1 Tax=Ruegeria sp. PrR005 TaxID=2706882 RepID=A0A6B2NVH4_9RHOB|nr:surface lipoprotein assembly modifier [Ruegeria sp. PrR005]NDW47438.1 DUF560 domain-containing protein [Ruegeria sp. PrR005]
MPVRLRTLLTALPAALMLLAGSPATSEQLTADQLRATAHQALRVGAPERAYAFSRALLHRDPNDRQALLIHSSAARTLGRFDEAKSAAKSAWALSTTDDQKFASSMLMAQALSSAGQRTMAQWWLRRAVEHAPNDDMTRIAIRDFKYVRARNPWLTRLSFSITPDSNINNGSSQRSSFLNYRLSEAIYGQPVEYQLGGTALALSGVEYSLGLTTRYRFRETPTRAHDLIFTTDLRAYTLSSEAKTLAPTAKASDFAFASYTLGYGQRGMNFDRRGEYRFVVDLGQSWYGGDEYARFARLSLGQTYQLKQGRQINARIAGERQWGVTRSDQDTVRADLSYTLPLGGGTILWTNLTGAVATSSVAADEFTELGLRAQLVFAKPVFGATAQLGLWARNRDYDVSPHSRNGRQEDKIEADFTLIFNEIDYYGFNPTMRISASRTDSNIALYDAKRFGVNFGIQSAF